jgi:pSer/pThr/pTyr-binding forkhead associated (FHA) protein
MPNFFLVRYPEEPIPVPQRGTITIGRSDVNTIILTESRASREHAKIEWRESRQTFVIIDLGSSNGTYLNSRKLTSLEDYPLKDWDKIRIASSVYTARLVDSPAIIENEFEELRQRVCHNATEVIPRSYLKKIQQQSSFSGDLEHLCPIELFQMLETGQKTGFLTVQTETGEANFCVLRGQIIAGLLNNITGEQAVFDVLKLTKGPFAFLPQTEIKVTPQITMSTTALLMEGCRLMDEEISEK